MTITALENVDVLNTDIRAYLQQSQSYIELMENIEKAKEESCEVVVVTASDVNTASNYISNYKKISKNVEVLRKNLTQPLVDKKAEIDAFFKSIPLEYCGELERLEKELLDFKRQQEAKAREEAEAERKRLEEEAIQRAIVEEERRKKEAQAKGVPVENIVPVEPAIVAEVIPQTKKISQMNTSGVKTRRTKKVVICDMVAFVHSLNDEEIVRFLEPNMVALNAVRASFDFESKSPYKGIEFTFVETIG